MFEREVLDKEFNECICLILIMSLIEILRITVKFYTFYVLCTYVMPFYTNVSEKWERIKIVKYI